MLRNSLIREMAFKANFLLWMGVELLWFIGQIIFIEVIFGYVDRIGDWTKWEVVLLVGTHQLIAQIFQAFFTRTWPICPNSSGTGRFDFLLLQPIDTQFAVSTKAIRTSIISSMRSLALRLLSRPLSRWRSFPRPARLHFT